MGLRIRFLPFLFLGGYAICIWQMFPIFMDISTWIYEGLRVPYIGWALLGAASGLLYYRFGEVLRKRIKNPMNKLGVGLVLWLGSSILISVALGEGDLQDRVLNSGLIRAWFVAMFGIFMAAPTFLGSYSIMARSKEVFSLAILGSIMVPLACMIYLQAQSVSVPRQVPLLSLITALTLFGFVETFHWSYKYDRIGVQGSNLFARQLISTIFFVGVGSGLAYIAFSWRSLIPDIAAVPFYEMGTIFGTAAIGLALLSPIALLAVVRSFRDRK
ncbi:MAG: hypothetical protein KAH57_07470 [Thermoplasmata archaeon]|nr:hypothetical protein [Thermoplasmata archaeon]